MALLRHTGLPHRTIGSVCLGLAVDSLIRLKARSLPWLLWRPSARGRRPSRGVGSRRSPRRSANSVSMRVVRAASAAFTSVFALFEATHSLHKPAGVEHRHNEWCSAAKAGHCANHSSLIMSLLHPSGRSVTQHGQRCRQLNRQTRPALRAGRRGMGCSTCVA